MSKKIGEEAGQRTDVFLKNFYDILDWDTNFFGFKVAKIKNDILQGELAKQYLHILYRENIHLAYYNSKEEVDFDFDENLYEIQFIVKRFPLLKKDIKKTPMNPKIELYDKDYPEEELITLGQLAGRQGRFGRDPNVGPEKCDEIFRNWVINSVNKNMATHVLVYRDQGRIVGFCTIDIRGEIGYSPLFAVERSSEGKGISFALMRAAENIFIENGCKYASGGTQELNKKALKVYERFGLMPQEPEYIYHFWSKQQSD